jgi:hypothetical protein
MRVRGHHQHLDRQHADRVGGRHLLALAGVALMAASAAVGLGLIQTPTVQVAAPASAPGWKTGAVLCRHDPMAYVPHPTRFLLLSSCSTVSGIVRQVRRDPTDGELNMLVAVDRAYARSLPSENQGLLRAAVVPRDVPRVKIPRSGQHATFYGAWVLDRNQRSQAAMHPVWMIEVSDRSTGLTASPAPAASPKAAAAGRLRVDIRAPRSVPIGGAIDVSVWVESGERGAGRPLPEANLFFEVRTEDGRGVQWKAAATNALGMARVTLVALERPGSFRLWLYVDKLARSAVVSAPVTVRRR